jgi:hypothetical protein
MAQRQTTFSETLVACLNGRVAGTAVDVYTQVTSGAHAEVITPSQVAKRARHVMEQAKSRAVLVRDGDRMLSIEAWPTWYVGRQTPLILQRWIPDGATDIDDLRAVGVNWSLTGGLAQDLVTAFEIKVDDAPDPEFTATDLHRKYRRVLNAAKQKPVFIDHRESLLTIDDWSRRQFESSVLSVLQDVIQFHQVRDDYVGLPTTKWAPLTRYWWVSALPDEEIAEFANDLFPYLLESVRRGSLEGFMGNLRAWETACSFHANRHLRDRLQRAATRDAEIALIQAVDPEVVLG